MKKHKKIIIDIVADITAFLLVILLAIMAVQTWNNIKEDVHIPILCEYDTDNKN